MEQRRLKLMTYLKSLEAYTDVWAIFHKGKSQRCVMLIALFW